MRRRNLIGALLLVTSLLLHGSRAMAAVWTDHYDASGGYSSAGEGISTITFDDWGYAGPGGRTAKYFLPINGFGPVGQLQHVATLWPDRLTPDNPQNILKDMTNFPVYTNANMDAQVNFYYWGYTSPGFDRQNDYSAYKAGNYSASTRPGSLFNSMMIDLDGDYLVYKNDMHFGYYDAFSYVDSTGVNAPQNVVTSLSFQPYPVSDAIGWCGSVLAPHPAALAVMAGQLTFDFAFDVYSGTNHVFMGTQIVPAFEMRSYGTLTVNVWAGADLQTFSSEAVINNTNPANKDRWDVDSSYYNLVSFHGGGVLPDGVWISADSYNPDGSGNLNADGTWNVTVVPAGTAGAIWHNNAFAGYAFILRADGLRMIDWYDQTVYGPDPCANKNCNDGNTCTTDSCVGGVCVNTPVACPSGQACVPATGTCAPSDFCAAVVCNDNNTCTSDSCDPAIGCVYTPIVCNDGNACTNDSCVSATGCVYTPIICNDSNACTTDTCSPASGCVYTPTVVCNDSNPCTTDSCAPATGACVFTPVSCDDGNSCTTDSCNSATGACVHTFANTCGTVDTTNNNFTMNQPDGTAFGGSNDVRFTWDGTRKTSVAASGQVSNATLASTCPFFGKTWAAHDVAVYGPGTYTVYAGCASGSPGCGTGTPITFTVNAGELGGHMLFNWNNNNNIDVVDVWKRGSYDQGVDPELYAPAPMWTGACGSNPETKVWDWMSYDWDGDGVNGYSMVDGPFVGMNANFNVMGAVDLCSGVVCNDNSACTTDSCVAATGACVYAADTNACPVTAGNNFSMIDPGNNPFGGTNDVVFAWDGTKRTSVAVSGQVSNATISSACPFFGVPWTSHDVTVYGPGRYCVDTNCATGSPGCGSGAQICFTVKAGEIGIHMLFDWAGNNNIDVVNVMKPNTTANIFTGGCGSNATCTVWEWASYDFDGDGISGAGMVDGPFVGMNANFNLNKVSVDLCCDSAARCNDGNVCTTDACDAATGACVYTPISCNDNNACTTDSCDPATGCVYKPIPCDDGNACTTDSCDPVIGCIWVVKNNCDDNNACTDDVCDPASGCINMPIICNDGNACTIDTCSPATGCAYTLISCDDNNACTADSCNPATGCVNAAISANDSNACTIESCDPATGVVIIPVNCDDGNACTADSCNPSTGCVHAEVVCNDGSACTADSCDASTGACVYTPVVCNDGSACTADSCDTATGACVYTPVVCNDSNACTADSCDQATGCMYTSVTNGSTCSVNDATGICTDGICNPTPVCPAGSVKNVIIRGGGQKPGTVDMQIQTEFSVVGDGCIVGSTTSTVTVSPGTVLQFNCKAGIGPHPTSGAWQGVPLTMDTTHEIVCPNSSGDVGKLVLDNKDAGGKDADRMTVKVQ